MGGERLQRILAELAAGVGGRWEARLCAVSTVIVGMSGAGIMLMSDDVPQGSVCTSNDVSALIEDWQDTLREGPCVDAFQHGRVVFEPDLADPRTPRWLGFTPRAVEAGVRALFGFPMRVGTVRLGALNLYRDRPGPLSDDQHADALVMADVAARWVLDVQVEAPSGALAQELELGSDFHSVVQNAAGIVSVQLALGVTEASSACGRTLSATTVRLAMSPEPSSPGRCAWSEWTVPLGQLGVRYRNTSDLERAPDKRSLSPGGSAWEEVAR